jgi:hypothetical protein
MGYVLFESSSDTSLRRLGVQLKTSERAFRGKHAVQSTCKCTSPWSVIPVDRAVGAAFGSPDAHGESVDVPHL